MLCRALSAGSQHIELLPLINSPMLRQCQVGLGLLYIVQAAATAGGWLLTWRHASHSG